MTMIRHQQEQMRPPELAVLAIGDGLEDRSCAVIARKLINAARQAIKCEEPDLSLRIDP
jgi:hypothetical protein